MWTIFPALNRYSSITNVPWITDIGTWRSSVWKDFHHQKVIHSSNLSSRSDLRTESESCFWIRIRTADLASVTNGVFSDKLIYDTAHFFFVRKIRVWFLLGTIQADSRRWLELKDPQHWWSRLQCVFLGYCGSRQSWLSREGNILSCSRQAIYASFFHSF
jgi:hypothetical protein